MANITGTKIGWRPRGVDQISVCEKCGIVVPPDRDGCPNGAGIVAEIENREDAHFLTTYLSRDYAEQWVRNETERQSQERRRADLAFDAIESAESLLELAKKALRG